MRDETIREAIKVVTILGMIFFFCLLGCNLFGQHSPAPAAETIEQKWVRLGLAQPPMLPEMLPFVKGYKIKKLKLAGLALVAVGGFTNGLLQGYEFDGRTSFERKWGASPTGFWGSLSWTQRYVDGNPAYGVKSLAYRYLPVPDFYHVTQITHHHALVTGGIFVGIGAARSNRRWEHYALDLLVSAVVNSAAQSAGLYYIRN